MQFRFRFFLICILCLFSSIISFAQKTPNGEVGLQLGGVYYLGDLNKVPFKSTNLSVGGFYRHNFNYRFSAKGVLSYAKVGASDSTHSNPYQRQRNNSFKRPCFSFNAMGEFNFLPFVVGDKKRPYTTYLQGGIGVNFFPDDSKLEKFVLDIPFGFGAKFNTTGKFVYGADFLMMKTFSDNFDFVSSNTTEKNKMKQKYSSSNMDWLSYFGIYLSYRIDYPQKCPTFD